MTYFYRSLLSLTLPKSDDVMPFQSLIVFVCTILLTATGRFVEEKEKRPNIVFIMSDDHAYQAVSADSDRLMNTPNIDRIVQRGMLFTNACVTNSICAPSRAVLFTGKHSHINGKIDNRFPFDASQETFPQILQNLDFAQTLLEPAGIDPPDDMQGESLMPLLKEEGGDFRDAAYYGYYEYPSVHMVKRHYAIVTEEYKSIHFYYDVDEWELYDCKKDENEMTNVIDNPDCAEVVVSLKQQLQELRGQYKDSEELDRFYIDKYLE